MFPREGKCRVGLRTETCIMLGVEGSMPGGSMGLSREAERGLWQQEDMCQILNVIYGVLTNLLKCSPAPGRNINERNE